MGDARSCSTFSALASPNLRASSAMPGHIYLLRATDTNSDVYALVRVESVERGECEVAWKQLDVQAVTRDGKLVLGSPAPSRVED